LKGNISYIYIHFLSFSGFKYLILFNNINAIICNYFDDLPSNDGIQKNQLIKSIYILGSAASIQFN